MDADMADGPIFRPNRLEKGRSGDREGALAEIPATVVSLREVHLQLERVCRILLWPSPEALDGCENLLASAAAELEASQSGWQKAAGDRLAGEEARLARKTLGRAGRLLGNASNFHARWQRMRAAMSGGYQADGAPGQLRCPTRIFVEG